MDPHVFHAEIEIVKSQQSSHRREQERLSSEISRLGQRDAAVNIEIIHLRNSVEKLNNSIDKLAGTVDKVDEKMNQNLQGLQKDLQDVSASNLRWALGVATTLISVTLTLAVTVG